MPNGGILTTDYTGAAQITLTLTPGVWFCSYLVRLTSNNSATMSSFNANLSIPNGIAGVSPNNNNAYSGITYSPGTITIGTTNVNNPALTGSVVFTTTTTQIVTLVLRTAITTGTASYTDSSYLMSTRIA
jgi:hypothetical protein